MKFEAEVITGTVISIGVTGVVGVTVPLDEELPVSFCFDLIIIIWLLFH